MKGHRNCTVYFCTVPYPDKLWEWGNFHEKIFFILVSLMLVMNINGCGGAGQTDGSSQQNESGENKDSVSNEGQDTQEGSVQVASDGAQMQTDNPAMPTRVIENGTKINMHFGDTIIPGILNDSDTAKALIEMLPYTVQMSSYSHDFCGVMPDELPYHEEEVHYGWLNGDIDYAIDAPYFTILHSDEEISEQYGYQVNIGVITCELSKIRDLSGSYDVLIELAE